MEMGFQVLIVTSILISLEDEDGNILITIAAHLAMVFHQWPTYARCLRVAYQKNEGNKNGYDGAEPPRWRLGRPRARRFGRRQLHGVGYAIDVCSEHIAYERIEKDGHGEHSG
jgi:hypothetical protein